MGDYNVNFFRCALWPLFLVMVSYGHIEKHQWKLKEKLISQNIHFVTQYFVCGVQ